MPLTLMYQLQQDVDRLVTVRGVVCGYMWIVDEDEVDECVGNWYSFVLAMKRMSATSDCFNMSHTHA
jgi:hypothetical protein